MACPLLSKSTLARHWTYEAKRLRKARISFVTTNYDVANARPSPSHASLSVALVDTMQEDTGLLRQRHELVTMEIQGADESILIRPGCGTAQGSEGAADAFHRVYHKRIDKWSDHLRAELLQEALIFNHLLRSQIFLFFVFMGLTTCQDDVRVTSITTEPAHTLSRVMANNAALDNALDEMAQNAAKQEHPVFFAGQRARQDMAALSGKEVLPGSTGPVARYLGPHLDIMGSIRPELERRRAAALSNLDQISSSVVSCRRPIASSAPFFFQALVVSILFSGLEALRLRPPDYEYLDRFVLGLGRKMMRGKATISTKPEDGTEKKHTVVRRKVWDFLGMVPSATELHARRLKWYQNLMKDPRAHQDVLFSFFGEASFQSDTIFNESGMIREGSCRILASWT